jgi:urease beta subunit
VRFEPGQTHEVELIDLGGSRQIIGFNRLVEGPVDDKAVREKALQNIKTFLGES